MHGTGDMRWSNGDRFSGEWKESKATGRGKLVLKNGLAYDGDLEDWCVKGFTLLLITIAI